MAAAMPAAGPSDARLNAILGLPRSLFREGASAEEGKDKLIKREEAAARANLSGGGAVFVTGPA